MHSPLLNSYIFICKLMICITVLIALHTHHWMQEDNGRNHHGLKQRCYEYGSNCYKDNHIQRKIWLYLIIPILNVIIESSNILLLLCTRSRSRINLILEEITLVTSLVFIVPNVFIVLAICVYAHSRYEEIDWSMKIYFISVILCLIDFVCSVVRVVSYCRHNSFRSHPVTYTSNSNHETINIQSE
ncbi:unnamed protein product [Adineta steineri]|uniref:Uncharacterized protein n=1 Tax=Adineta steineri TaxID=433720 RepID=A0A815LM05_9BILA|nr:unnamed protein product [Adineta steineri]